MPGPDTLRKLLELAENRYHGGEYAEAIQLWEKALSLDPDNRRAREGAMMAKMLINAGGKLPVEKSALSGANGEQPSMPIPDEVPESLDGVGDLHGLLEDNKAVENDIQQHINRGWELLKEGDRDGAMLQCQEALVLDGSHPGVMELHAALSEDGAPLVEEVEVPPDEDSPAAETTESPETPFPTIDDDFQPPAAKPAPEPIAGSPAVPDTVAPDAGSAVEPAMPVDIDPALAPETGPPAATPATGQPAMTPETGSPAVAPEGDPSAVTAEGADTLIPDALKAGGTEYGQWENEFSELDLDQSVRNVGTDPVSASAADDGSADAGPSDPDTPVQAADAVPGSEPDPEPIPLTGPGEMVIPESTVSTGTPPPGPAPDEGDTDEIPVPADGAPDEFDDEPPELAASVITPPPVASRGVRGGKGLIAVVVLAAAAAAAGWFFFLRGTGFSAGRNDAPPQAAPSDGASGPETSGPPGPPQERPVPGAQGVEEIRIPEKPGPSAPDEPEPVRPLSESERRKKVREMLRTGRQLYQQGKYQQAVDILNGALAIDPVNFELKDLLDQAVRKVQAERKAREDLELARRAFEDGDYEITLRKLYRTPTGAEQEPTRTYIRNTWFNWGVQLLKAGNCPEAMSKFNEVLAISPDDQEVIKLANVADRYSLQAKDDIFFAFVDRLANRDFDHP